MAELNEAVLASIAAIWNLRHTNQFESCFIKQIYENCTIKKLTNASRKCDKSSLPGLYCLSSGELKDECRVENQHPAKKMEGEKLNWLMEGSARQVEGWAGRAAESSEERARVCG
jgi:hypothetical protein